MKFYSQHGEDKWIAENLPLPATGIFVEVGAADGRENSNTLFLEERGWRGLVVEPDKRQHPALYQNRHCFIASCAAGKPREIEGESRDFALTDNPTHSGFLRTAPKSDLVGVFSLGYLCALYGFGAVDLLSIDTEGTEIEVWESLPQVMRPPIVIVEWSTEGLGSGDNSADVMARMTADGYDAVHKTACNLIFSKRA